MTPVNWDLFARLPGSADSNFEALCRALIRRHYGRFGDFNALAAQPGVEFHLKLHTPCSLGEPGRWFGWQCRWYGLPSGRALGDARKKKIARAIATTEKVLPNVTDWVLWTRHPLSAGDQKWFKGIKSRMRLHQWTSAEVEAHLTGEAEILRSTYFGDLILAPELLATLHRESVAPIRRRWQPETHQIVDAERDLRKMLGEVKPWDHLRQLADDLESGVRIIRADSQGLAASLADATNLVINTCQVFSGALRDTHTALVRGDLDLLGQELDKRPPRPDQTRTSLPHRLRAGRQPAALSVTNAIADLKEGSAELDEVNALLRKRLVAVLADAGCGKTQLAAQLTAPQTDRPAGILLHGRDLHAGHNLDDLARRVTVSGVPVHSLEALLASVDAAGQRAHRRLPIVIDGLNEAEDPRIWKSLLASANEVLRRFPYVLLVCTLRKEFAAEAVPDNADRMKIEGFGHDAIEAVRKYSAHYKINFADAELPIGLLRHPLTLRLFCEVTNPTREKVVGVEAMPGSLTALFEAYLKQAAERIAELAPRTRRYYEHDVRVAFHEIGYALWQERSRNLDFSQLRVRLQDSARPWNESIVRALEHEGVLLRVRAEPPSDIRLTIAYDALAGHLAASSILATHESSGFELWIKASTTLASLGGDLQERHPLASDVFRALVGLVPRRLYRQQLWTLLDGRLRTVALRGAADLEGTYIDGATIEAVTQLTLSGPNQDAPDDLFNRLRQTRGSASHPLNSEFLDGFLRPLPVSERDLRWTEWVRLNKDDNRADLGHLAHRWQAHLAERSQSERLRARWVMWCLSSTVRQLRDLATNALYWFGRGDPGALFELTSDTFAINDLYISERMLAACYGVTMAHQTAHTGFAQALRPFLIRLQAAFSGSTAQHPTNHYLARLYAKGVVTLALKYHPEAVPEEFCSGEPISFAAGPAVQPILESDLRKPEVSRTLHMDFENYTLGRLFDDRANYDMSHKGHRDALSHVRGVVWNLGWRENELGAVDRSLMSESGRSNRAHTERYGKKYGWIGYYTYAGILDDKGGREGPRDRLSDVDIDPSFPEQPQPATFQIPAWATQTPVDDRRWIKDGVIAVPDELFFRQEIHNVPGPWMAVDGYLSADQQSPGRYVFGFLEALLVAPEQADGLKQALKSRERPSVWWTPRPPEDYYTFAGEIPWSQQFGAGCETDPYRGKVEAPGNSSISVEILSHHYAWESYHSALNKVGGAIVPSRAFSQRFDLRGLPQSFDQVLPDGTTVAKSLTAPAGFGGHLLYLREDFLHQFAGGRRLVWFIWGQRQIRDGLHDQPDWVVEAARSNADVWRQIRGAEELSRQFAQDAQRSRRKLPKGGWKQHP